MHAGATIGIICNLCKVRHLDNAWGGVADGATIDIIFNLCKVRHLDNTGEMLGKPLA